MAKKRAVTLDTLLHAVVSVQEQVAELPTRSEVEKIVSHILDEDERLNKIDEISKDMKALSKALDKDAETIVKQEKRITRIERHLAVT